MFHILENNSIDNINTIKYMIDFHERLSSENETMSNQIKFFSVSSCVTRLYAIYENFVETAISDYLDILSECVEFKNFSDEFKSCYRIGISTILNRIEQDKYKNLRHENIIKWYSDALSNGRDYKIVTQALTIHEQNLRLNILEQMLNKIQIKNLYQWLNNYPLIKSLYVDQLRISSQLESELKGFIQVRNDAAHGSLSSLESKENLIRLCDLVVALIQSLASCFRKYALYYLIESGNAKSIGTVTESFKRHTAFVVNINSGINLKIGMEIYCMTDENCLIQNVESLMINNVKIASITSKADSIGIGIKCEKFIKIGTEVFILNS